MTIAEAYLKGETKEGFYVEEKMKRAWAAQLEVLGEIRRVCDLLGLRFFADWGTLLGAVRHGGYIPWDDDLDIAMLRDEYEVFLEKAPDVLGAEFELKSIYNDPTHDNVKARVITGRSICFDRAYLERFHGCPYVVGVDIFPVDYVPRDAAAWERQQTEITLLMDAAASLPEKPPYSAKELALIQKIEQTLNVRIPTRDGVVHELKKLVDITSAKFGPDDADEVASMIDLALGWDYHARKEWYETSVEMPFESTTIPVPAGYDGLLRIKYGDNYMTPVRGGGSHDYPFYAKQEQGLKAVIEEEFGISLSQEELDGLIAEKIRMSLED